MFVCFANVVDLTQTHAKCVMIFIFSQRTRHCEQVSHPGGGLQAHVLQEQLLAEGHLLWCRHGQGGFGQQEGRLRLLSA